MIPATSTLLALVAGTALVTGAHAEELKFGGGVTVLSDYLSEGASQTEGRPAIQPFVEVSFGNIYGGFWASNLRDTEGNRAELDIYTGYRSTLANGLGYDLSYTQHFYDKTHDQSSEIAAALSFDATDKLTLLAEATYDLQGKTFGKMFGLDYGLTDALTLSTEIGQPDKDAGIYLAAGASYDFAENAAVSLQYQKTQSDNGKVALSLNYRFGSQGE